MAKTFHHHESLYSDSSAEVIVPLLVDLFNPKTVVDVGCGIANFLKIFLKYNIENVKGLDGAWVDLSKLAANIPVEKFQKIDLEREFEQYAQENAKKYDLLISLEVAEHLSVDYSKNFIKSLCALSDTIVFSAAVPLQGGQNHLNEQWHSYWIKIFNEMGYVGHDKIRKLIWQEPNVHWWYRQNIFLFTKSDRTSVEWSDNNFSFPTDIIHPAHFMEKASWINDIETGNISWKFVYHHVKNILKSKLK